MNYDVIVIGLGPVGAVTANYLGLWGLKTLVLEKEFNDHGQPRAFSCDEEAMRIYQQIGLDKEIINNTFADDVVDYIGARGQVFAQLHIGKVDTGFGFQSLHLFHQPLLEKILRDGFRKYPTVETLLGVEVTGCEQKDEKVNVSARNLQTGELSSFSARYLLACDGARSGIRELLGITMEGIYYPEPCLAISGIVRDEYVKINNTSFVCDPFRPVFVGRGPSNQYRLEFKLRPEETKEQIERPEVISKLIEPYIDPTHFTIQRATVYTFHNKQASAWRNENIFLLGDAAHTMPPFMGQGLVSGLRDVANLVWKIAFVIKGFHAGLLNTYEEERRPHTREMADMSVTMGNIFLTASKAKAHFRDAFFSFLFLIPPVRDFIRYVKFKPKPLHKKGLYTPTKAAGTYFPQPDLTDRKGVTKKMDELIGKGFAIIVSEQVPAFKKKELWIALECTTVHAAQYTAKNDVLNKWFKKYGVTVALLRPDRFVLATCTDDTFEKMEELVAQILLK